MCRTKGSTNKKLQWCVGVRMDGVTIKEDRYTSLSAAAQDLGVTSNMLYKLRAKPRSEKKRRFSPVIYIHRLEDAERGKTKGLKELTPST